MSKTIVGRILVCVATAVLLLLLFAYGTMWILVKGPSPTAKKLFVLSVKETSAGGFLADIYLSKSEIDAILSPSVDGDLSQDEQDLSMIVVPPKEEVPPAVETTPPDTSDSPVTEPTPETENTSSVLDDTDTGIEILDIKGSTYNGKLMIIADPARVFVGVPDSYGADSYGLTVAKMIEKYDCIAGTNAGGFYDPNGQGTGGIPDGIVIYEGELLTAAHIPGIEENLIIIDSVSKRFSACGARIGALISRNKEFMQAAMKLAQARLSVATVEQYGAAALYSVPDTYFEAVREEYRRRRDVCYAGLTAIPGIVVAEPKGAFYMMAKLPVDNAEKFQTFLLEEFEDNNQTVTFAPGNGFYATPGAGEQEIRVAYVLQSEDLQRALELLKLAIEKYQAKYM